MDIRNWKLEIRNSRRRRGGFTLIELLVVIGILAVLLAIVLIAINPARQFSQARDTQRWSDVNAILNAVHQYYADNGSLPSSITTTPTKMGDGVGEINICSDLVTTYLAAMPYDPSASGAAYTSCASYDTGYNISKSATNNRLTVAAPSAEIESSITVTR